MTACTVLPSDSRNTVPCGEVLLVQIKNANFPAVQPQFPVNIFLGDGKGRGRVCALCLLNSLYLLLLGRDFRGYET